MNNFFRVVTDYYTMRLLLQQSHGIDQERYGYATIHLGDNCCGWGDRLVTSLSRMRHDKNPTSPQYEMVIAVKSGRLLDCNQVRIAGVNDKELVTGRKFDQRDAVLGHSDPQ